MGFNYHWRDVDFAGWFVCYDQAYAKGFHLANESMYFLATAVGSALNAQIVGLYNPTTEVHYFLGFGTAAIALGILMLFMVKTVKRLMDGIQ
jgi:POT family proton-dependent oligopeptide transporter